jgi:signal transduction histidine kinase
MAHDLKTPLASIMAYSENLEESADDRAKVIEYSGKITDKVTDMNHMIEDILVLSKTGTAKADISTLSCSVRRG